MTNKIAPPKPWMAKKTNPDTILIKADNGTTVCIIDRVRYNEDVEDITATAKLIEQTPNLLDILGSMTNELSHLYHNGKIKANAPERDRIKHLILRAEYVIEKSLEGSEQS